MKTVKIAVVLVCALVVATSTFAASPIKPGKWETSMKMEIPNMPFQMPAVKFTTCITPEQAENPEQAVPKGTDGGKKNSSCKIENMKIDGGKVSYDMNCPKEKMTGKMEMEYTDSAYSGKMIMNTEGQEMTAVYTGKLLGACDAKK